MKKRAIRSLVLSAILSTSVLGGIISAESSISNNTIPSLQIIEEIVVQSDVIEIVDLDQMPEGTPVIEFDTVEEFEKAIKQLEEEQRNNRQRINIGTQTPQQDLSNENVLAASTVDSLNILLKPVLNPVKEIVRPNTMHVGLGYDYSGSRFTSINSVTSVPSETTGGPWNQTSYTRSYFDSQRGVTVTVNGYYNLIISIGGFPIGSNISDSFAFDYKIGMWEYISEK